MRALWLLLAVPMVSGQETQKPAEDPVSDRMRYEIAVLVATQNAAQRDMLIAQRQYEQAAAQLQTRVAAADKLCSGQSKRFDLNKFRCEDK